MTRSRVQLACAHLAGNGLLLLLGYYWLGLAESNAAHLIFSAVVILFFALGAIWLHATALVLFQNELGLRASALRVLRHLPPLFILTLIVILLYLLLQFFYNSFGHTAFTVGSYSTMKLRRPVAPDNVLKGFHFLIWILRWFVLPVLLLPLASQVADRGWPGFRRSAFAKSRRVIFWMEAGVLLVAAIHLPLHLFLWIPVMPNFPLEVLSVTSRLGLGYLLFTAGLLALEFVTSAGKPRVTQLNTVVSP